MSRQHDDSGQSVGDQNQADLYDAYQAWLEACASLGVDEPTDTRAEVSRYAIRAIRHAEPAIHDHGEEPAHSEPSVWDARDLGTLDLPEGQQSVVGLEGFAAIAPAVQATRRVRKKTFEPAFETVPVTVAPSRKLLISALQCYRVWMQDEGLGLPEESEPVIAGAI